MLDDLLSDQPLSEIQAVLRKSYDGDNTKEVLFFHLTKREDGYTIQLLNK